MLRPPLRPARRPEAPERSVRGPLRRPRGGPRPAPRGRAQSAGSCQSCGCPGGGPAPPGLGCRVSKNCRSGLQTLWAAARPHAGRAEGGVAAGKRASPAERVPAPARHGDPDPKGRLGVPGCRRGTHPAARPPALAPGGRVLPGAARVRPVWERKTFECDQGKSFAGVGKMRSRRERPGTVATVSADPHATALFGNFWKAIVFGKIYLEFFLLNSRLWKGM